MSVSNILVRKVKQAQPAPQLDPVPAMRRAMRRSVDINIGVDAVIDGGAIGSEPLLDQLKPISQQDLVLALNRDGTLAGAVVLNASFWRAVVEQKTLGRILQPRADDRAPTGTDATLCKPILTRFLDELRTAAPGTFAWCNGLSVGARIDLPRIIELSLPAASVSTLLIDCAIGAGSAVTAQRVFAVPPPTAEKPRAETPSSTPWRAVAETLPAVLDAVLHRFDVPLNTLNELVPGQCLPLDGASLDTLRLEGSGGIRAASGRLGRLGALRAVRIQPLQPPELEDMGLGGAAPATPPLIDAPDSGDPLDMKAMSASPDPDPQTGQISAADGFGLGADAGDIGAPEFAMPDMAEADPDTMGDLPDLDPAPAEGLPDLDLPAIQPDDADIGFAPSETALSDIGQGANPLGNPPEI